MKIGTFCLYIHKCRYLYIHKFPFTQSRGSFFNEIKLGTNRPRQRDQRFTFENGKITPSPTGCTRVVYLTSATLSRKQPVQLFLQCNCFQCNRFQCNCFSSATVSSATVSRKYVCYTSPVQLFLANKNHLPDPPLNPTPSSSAGKASPMFSASSSSSSSTELMCSSCRTLK